MRKPLALIVALVALLTGLLSGCANSPSTAAAVGDAIIRENRLDDTAKALQGYAGGNLGELRGDALSLMIRQQLGEQILADRGLTLAESDRQTMLEDVDPKVLADAELKPLALADIDLQLINKELGNDGFMKALDAIPVEVNPMHGEWDPQTLLLSKGNQALAKAWTKQR